MTVSSQCHADPACPHAQLAELVCLSKSSVAEDFYAEHRRNGLVVAEHWLLRGEYLHTEFGSITGFGRIACTAGVGNCVGAGFRTTFQFSSRFTEDVGRVALSYKF